MGYRSPTYFCKRCKTEKLWYKFPWGIGAQFQFDEKNAICIDCNKKGFNTDDIAKKYLLQNRIERLANLAMKNNMSALRDHLFETLEKVKDNQIAHDKVKSICEIAQTIINSAKVEVEYIKAIGGKNGSGFMQLGNGTES